MCDLDSVNIVARTIFFFFFNLNLIRNNIARKIDDITEKITQSTEINNYNI